MMGRDLTIATSVVPLTRDEARALTDRRIRETVDQLWSLLLEAHERHAWKALSYASWREYAVAEFNMSQGHAYRLLDQGRIIRELEAVANSPVGEISERVIRDIKPRLALVTAEISERIADGEIPKDAVQATLVDVRQRLINDGMSCEQTPDGIRVRRPDEAYITSRKENVRDNRYVANIVVDVVTEFEFDIEKDVGYTNLDPACIDLWVKELRQSARKITRFARRLQTARTPGITVSVQPRSLVEGL